MEIPPFSDFVRSVDFNKLSYDLESIAPAELKESSSLFTEAQYSFISNTVAAMSLSLLQQYHQWLAEQIAE